MTVRYAQKIEETHGIGTDRLLFGDEIENKQTILLILIDLFICIVSYLLGGYLWLTFYHNLTVPQIVQSYDVQMLLFENLPIILFLYLGAILLFNIENGFIRRSIVRVLWASLKSGVIMLLAEAMVVFVRIRLMPDASRGTYICIAVVNFFMFFVAHMLLRYYLLKVHRNRKNVPQMFLVTTTDRLERTLRECASEWNYRLCAITLIDEDQIGRVIHLEDYRTASSKSRAEKDEYQRSQVMRLANKALIKADEKTIRRWDYEFHHYIPNTPTTEYKHMKQDIKIDAYAFALYMVYRYSANPDGSVDIGLPPMIADELMDRVQKRFAIKSITGKIFIG